MSESKNDTQTQVTEPKPTLAAGLFKPFKLGSTLSQGEIGNVMENMKASPFDYEKAYQNSTKNQSIAPQDLEKIQEGEVKKSKFKEVSSAIQRKEGYSKERADAITAAAGRKELGEKEMERRSKEAKKSMTEDEVLAAIPADHREPVIAELDRRVDEAKKSNNQPEAERIEKAKAKAKKAWEQLS